MLKWMREAEAGEGGQARVCTVCVVVEEFVLALGKWLGWPTFGLTPLAPLGSH